MKNIKVAIIGVGGRTGTMFAFELKNRASVLGVAKEKEIELIAQKKLYIQRKEQEPQLFDCKVIKDSDFNSDLAPDIIFVTTKNPVYSVVKYYFEKFKNDKTPVLFLSQNGIDALNDAKKALQDIYGQRAKDITIIRSVLFNPIDIKIENSNIYVKYSLPIRIAVSKAQGKLNVEDVFKTFKNAGFEIQEFPQENARNLEFSKLFLNLIGMVSASHNLSVKNGFKDKNIFQQEVKVLKEYVRVVKKSNGRFINFSNYPVKTYCFLIDLIPMFFLVPIRNILARFISKGREKKAKDLDEIEYYNGAVVKLGKTIGVNTPINELVLKRV
ncbi:MAG: hypothetical protein KJI70_01975 [Patescibacteria group bacterium]|nr:hypothetical protein [Patescibacteria group bacterium]